jgi:hypothetical protein
VRFTARVVGTLGAILASLVFYVPGAGSTVVVGKHRVLAVLVSYGPRPFARASVAAALTEASTFLTRSSFGRLWLQTATTPWLEGGNVEPSCGASSDRLFTPLRSVAAGAGYQTADYDRTFYIVAGPDCGFHGIEFGNEVMIVREPDARLIVHELGHTFGLPHAGASAVCGTWCVAQEQGDLFSPMGVGFTDFSAYEKEQLGWIPRQPRVAHPGNYVVYPVSGRAVARQALVIEAPEGDYWARAAAGSRCSGNDRPPRQSRNRVTAFIAPTTLLLAPIRTGHPVISPGQTFRVPPESSP